MTEYHFGNATVMIDERFIRTGSRLKNLLELLKMESPAGAEAHAGETERIRQEEYSTNG